MTNFYKRTRNILLVALLLTGVVASAQTVSDFDSKSLSGNSFWNGAGNSVGGAFITGGALFTSSYQTSAAYSGYWYYGWALSNMKDSTTTGYANLYSSRAAVGANNSKNYGVGQQGSMMLINNPDTVKSLYINNATYAALSMLNGDGFAKKFGGPNGSDPDYFKLVIKGSFNNVESPDSVEFYLADFRDVNNANDYIVTKWAQVDVSVLNKVDRLTFTLRSSDAGAFGINTPTFFCIDDVVFENLATADFELSFLSPNSYYTHDYLNIENKFTDGNIEFFNRYSVTQYGDYWSKGWAYSNKKDSLIAGSTNQYSAITASGYNASSNYAIGQNNANARLVGNATGKGLDGFYLTNSTYAYRSMQQGDAFAKKFGGVSGNDPDFFKIVVYGYANGIVRPDSVEAYLADFRDADNSKDYILKTWKFVDLKPLGNIDSLSFVLRSSDVGQFGMNTPAYFCLDNMSTLDAPVGVSEVSKGNGVAAYPNPINAELFVNVQNSVFEDAQISLFDISGKQLLSGKLNGNAVYNTESLQQGIYVLQIKAANGSVHTQRIVKQ